MRAYCDRTGQDRVVNNMTPCLDDQIEKLKQLTTTVQSVNTFRGMLKNLTGQIELLVQLCGKIAIMASRQAKMEKELNLLLHRVQQMMLAAETE